MDAEALGALAESVRAQGLIQPVVVRPLGEGRYELIAGERRWRAARAAGLATVPALVRETDDRESLILALVENVAREDLTAIEEARAYALLQDEFALSLGERRRARRPLQAVGVEPAAPAGAPRRRARPGGARRPDRGPRPRRARRSRRR